MGKKKYVSSLDYTVRYCTSMKTEILDNIIYKSELIRRCRTNSLGVEIVAMVLGAKTASFENFPQGLSEICFWYPTAGGRNIYIGLYRIFSRSLLYYTTFCSADAFLLKKKVPRTKTICFRIFFRLCVPFLFFLLLDFRLF